jgi:hypothetical protein
LTAGIKANVDGSAAIQVGGVDAITLTSAGAASFVTSPMTIQGGSAAAPSLTFSGDTNTGIFSPAADTIAFAKGGVEAMRIDSSGNVGIGTSSPTYKLDVTGAGRFTGGAVINNNTWLFCQNTSGTYRDSFGYFTDNNLYITAWDGAMILRANGSTERARIATSGNFLVGTTNTTVGIGDLTTVTGSQLAPDGFVGATRPNEAAAYFTRTGSNGRVMNLYRDAAGVGGISVTTTGTTFNTTSDYRLKENVQPMQNALAKVSELKPVTYKWKVDGSDGQGFIAHELQALFPDAVDGEKDAVNSDGKPVYQGIDTSFLVATLTAAIQEQQQMIETLQAEVALLKGAA